MNATFETAMTVVSAPSEIATVETGATAAVAAPAGAPGDVVASIAVARQLQAYFVLNGSMSRTPVATSGEGDDVDADLDRSFGSALATLRTALPTALRAQFSAQLAAIASEPNGEKGAADEGNATLEERDALAMAQVGALEEDEIAARAAIVRIARYVAQHGAVAAALALHLAMPAIEPVAGFMSPARASVDASGRSTRERPRQRNDDGPPKEALDVNDETASTSAAYTLEDIFHFAGDTIAKNQQDYRSLPWPF